VHRVESNCILCNITAAVVGCVNPTMQPGMKMARNGDVITISCDVDGQITPYDESIWQMTCIGNQWIGSYGNCSASKCNYAQLYLLAVNDAYVAVSTKMVASEEKIHTYKNIQ